MSLVARGRARFVALVPLAAVSVLMMLAVFLPFVNRATTWLGLPSLFTWCAAGIVLLTPSLLIVERYWPHADEREEDGA